MQCVRQSCNRVLRAPVEIIIMKDLFKRLFRDQRGAILIITTAYLPVIVGFFSLAVDMAYVFKTRSTLQVTADAAALAAAASLPDLNVPCTVAQQYANTYNLPSGTQGNTGNVVSSCSDVIVGFWTCQDGQTCNASNFIPNASSACGI